MASAAQSRIKSISYAKYGYMFIAPFFLVYAFFQVWPLIYTFILSFHGNQSNVDAFVGFDNYTTLLFGKGSAAGSADAQALFLKSLKNTFILWIGNFVPQILLSLLLAVWFTDAKVKLPGKGFFKVVMYMPNIITAASVAALYINLFGDTRYSFVNGLLINMNIIKEDAAIQFVTGTIAGKAMVMFIQTWLWFGNTMIMLMSGIMGINPSFYEAADIDGANSRQTFFKITLPLLQPIMVYTLVTSMIGGLQMFDIPYLYHTGSTIQTNLQTVAVYIYSNFMASNPSYGYAGAASVITFLITAILGTIVFYMNRDKEAAARKKQRKEAIKAAKARVDQGGFQI